MIDLAAFPRVALGHWPTPLEPCHRLRAEIGGPLIWLKRDDCSGLALGGNKTRKLEFLLGEAIARDATGVVTFGALQSNHARQTAAACARIGLPCDLVLTSAVDRATPHYLTSGNRLLDGLFGAEVHEVDTNDAALLVAADLAEADPGRYFIDPGGSTPVGTLGYVAAAVEISQQADELGLDVERVTTAASTGGTAAGLAIGLAGESTLVEASAVYASASVTSGAIGRLIESTAALVSSVAPAAEWTVDDTFLGDGYGIPSPESTAAIATLARTEGVLLDPVYTSKAFAMLLARLPSIAPDRDVVFLHTGGQAGLFAYADDWS